jgi:hypothetical protein
LTTAINNPTAALSVRLPAELSEQAKQISKLNGLQLSSFVRQSIIREIKRHQADVLAAS